MILSEKEANDLIREVIRLRCYSYRDGAEGDAWAEESGEAFRSFAKRVMLASFSKSGVEFRLDPNFTTDRVLRKGV